MTTYKTMTPPDDAARQWARAAGLPFTPQLYQALQWAADWGAGQQYRANRKGTDQ